MQKKSGRPSISPTDRVIAANVCLLRKLSGYSRADLAGFLGVSYQQIHKYETGVNRLPASKLYILQGLFNVPYETFFHGVRRGAGMPARKAGGHDQLAFEVIARLKDIDSRTQKHKILAVMDILAS